MNCAWMSAIIVCAYSRCFSGSGENGSRNALFSPAVSTRRSTPSLSSEPAKPKPSMITPIEPTRLAGFT